MCPCRYWFWISSTRWLASSIISFLSRGMMMSSMPMVAPKRVAYLKPSSLMASSIRTVTEAPSSL